MYYKYSQCFLIILLIWIPSFASAWERNVSFNRWGDADGYFYEQTVTAVGEGSFTSGIDNWNLQIQYNDDVTGIVMGISPKRIFQSTPRSVFFSEQNITVSLRNQDRSGTQSFPGKLIPQERTGDNYRMAVIVCNDARIVRALERESEFQILIDGGKWYVRADVEGNLPTVANRKRWERERLKREAEERVKREQELAREAELRARREEEERERVRRWEEERPMREARTAELQAEERAEQAKREEERSIREAEEWAERAKREEERARQANEHALNIYTEENILNKVQSNWNPPQKHKNLTVVISFPISATGKVVYEKEIALVSTNAHRHLTQKEEGAIIKAAKNSVMKSQPFPPPPGRRREIVTIAVGVNPSLPFDNKNTAVNKTQTKPQEKSGKIGIRIGILDGGLMALWIAPGGPAAKAGISSGGRIIMIDGEPAQSFTIERAAAKLNGKPGTEVKLHIRHRGESEPREYIIKREVID